MLAETHHCWSPGDGLKDAWSFFETATHGAVVHDAENTILQKGQRDVTAPHYKLAFLPRPKLFCRSSTTTRRKCC
jgi:hypothetical protein